MESLRQSNDDSLDKIVEGIKSCDYVFLKLNNPEDVAEMEIKCIKDCACDNADYNIGDLILSLFIFEKKEELDAIFESECPDAEYYNRLDEFIKSHQNNESQDEENRSLIEKFDLMIWNRALNRFYYNALKTEGRLIDNPKLTEEEVMRLYEKFSTASPADIVKIINGATPQRLLRHK